MRDILNICLIDGLSALATVFRAMGHTVLNLKAAPNPFFHLPDALAEHDFTPDLVFQTETLTKRSIVTGLDQMDCPTMYWAIDPHLNAHWHSAYARLFDITCSTQRGWISSIRERGASDVRWLPYFGHDLPWTDMAERTHDLAFVGRITGQRPARKWMVEFLKEKVGEDRLAIEQNLSFAEMVRLYQDTRIVPNESIFGEVNFRLFEAASCGCLVLSQDLGEEQATLFEPGRELDTYANVVELDEKLTRYLKNPRLVRAMGMAARERVQAEHLPRHRAARILEYVRDAASCRASGAENAKWTALTACAQWEAGLHVVTAREMLSRLVALPQDEDVTSAQLRIMAMAGGMDKLADTVRTILGTRLYSDSFDLNFSGSMAALRVEHWDGAKAFWYRHIEATGARNPGPPGSPTELLTLWAKDLKRRGCVLRAGFPFDPKVHLPGSATECLLAILNKEPEHLPTLRLLDAMLQPIAGLEQTRVGFLSILTLHEREEWRLGFEIALANLRSYRLKSGMEELHLARDIAREVGQEAMFAKALAARDTSGKIVRMLGD